MWKERRVVSSIWVRSKIRANTDPQRRCYNGTNFSENWEWSDWKYVMSCSSKDAAEEIAAGFQTINPMREYRIDDKP